MRISVVIPTLDEADRLPPLILALQREPHLREIIVVDGGSTDRTPDLARCLGAWVIAAERGRGRQLHTGAVAAKAEILLFLHADSAFPPGGLDALVTLLDRDARIPGGNFRVVFDGESRFARGLTVFYNWIRRFALYYGDSGIFVRRSVYEALGGIKPIPLMEDYDFVQRLERVGPTCRIDDPPLITSSRKFEKRRPAAIVLGWVVVHLLYWLGISPDRLVRFYYPQGWRVAHRASINRQS